MHIDRYSLVLAAAGNWVSLAAAEEVVEVELDEQRGENARMPRLAGCSVIALTAAKFLRLLALRRTLYDSGYKQHATAKAAAVPVEREHSLEHDLDLMQMALASCECSVLHDWCVKYTKEVELDMVWHVLALAPRTTRSGEGRNEASAIAVAVVLTAVIHSDCHFCD
jgi:hypothetical protein